MKHRATRALVTALLASLLALHLTSASPAADTPDSAEKGTVARLGPLGDHWVWVPDRLLRHSLLYDGDTGEVLGMVDAGQQLTPKTPLVSRARGEVYSADLAYSRGSRGERVDFVSIYDQQLRYIDEIVVPTRVGESNTSQQYAELIDDRFLGVFNQFPNTSVSILDLDARAFVEEIVITGCAGIYPVGPRRFATLCGDGTALLVQLDPHGRKAGAIASERFFDVVEDPVSMSAGRDGARWTFVTFAGTVHGVDFSGDAPSVQAPWSLVSDSEREAGWRPGGLQYVAVHPATKRLYVVMHQGQPGSHKAPGPEIWAFDLASRQRVQRIEPPNLAVPFLAPFMGIAHDSFAYRLLGWIVPSPGVHTIAVSSDASPVLFARSAELGAVAVIDAASGETLRILTEAGLAGPTLRVP